MELKNVFEPEELTTDIDKAIFLFNDCSMLDGEFDCGERGLDHNGLKSLFPNLSWREIHMTYSLIRLVPETRSALVAKGQQITSDQKNLLKEAGYKIEAYC